MNKINVDCLSHIFSELQTDIKSLHSCLLVNRDWCHLIVPILWKKYPKYYYGYKSEKKLFNTILSCLPSDSERLLFDNDIELSSTTLSKPLLFNYISFCKCLKTEVINKIIEMVFGKDLNNKRDKKDRDKRNLLEQEIYKLFISQCKNIIELNLETSQPLSLFPGASTCFSQLYSLSVNIKSVNSDALYEMSKICKDLNILTIYGSRDLPGLISLIDAQKNLQRINFDSINEETCKELVKALARKGNTINELYANIIPFSFSTSLINLKMIEISAYYYKEIKKLRQCLAISEFTQLQSLHIKSYSPCFKELAMLIEKTKGNILQVIICIYNRDENTGMLIKAIANNCPNIEHLHTYLEPKDFIHVKSLLMDCRNLIGLKFHSSSLFTYDGVDVGDELLDILTEFSPTSLTEITISGSWKYSVDAFERFFESCRGRTLNRFDIMCGCNCITEDHKVILRKYINEGVIITSNYIKSYR